MAKAEPEASGAALAAQALDPSQQDKVAQAINQLTPEEAQIFLDVLERALEKRRIQLYGYIVAAAVLIVSVLGVFVYWGNAPEGEFVGWIMGIPFLLVGLTFWIFGKWSNRAATRLATLPHATARPKGVDGATGGAAKALPAGQAPGNAKTKG